jgi:hypothetical protein
VCKLTRRSPGGGGGGEKQDIAIKQDVRECHKCDNDSKKLTVIDVWLSVAKRANPFKKLIGDKSSASVVDVVDARFVVSENHTHAFPAVLAELSVGVEDNVLFGRSTKVPGFRV